MQHNTLMLSLTLVQATEMLELPVSRWSWQDEIDKLNESSVVELWFTAAKRALNIEVTACSDKQMALPNTVYLFYHPEQQWVVAKTDKKGRTFLANGESVVLPESNIWRVLPVQQQRKITWSSLIQLGQRDGKLITRLVWATFVINLLAIVMPLYLNAVYDRVMPGQASASLWTLSLGVILALFVEYIHRIERVKAGCQFIQAISQQIEPKLISDLIQVMPSQESQWGRRVLQAMNNWNRFRLQCLGLFSSTALDIAFSVIYFIVIFVVAGALVVVPLFIFMIALLRVTMFYFENNKIPAVNGQVPFTPNTLEVYQANSAYLMGVRRFESVNEKAQQTEQARFLAQSRCSSTLIMLMNVQTVLAVIGAFYLIQSGNMSPAGLFATIIISGRLGQPVFSLMQLLPNLQSMSKSMAEINQLLQEKPQEETDPQGYQGVGTGWTVSQASFKYYSALPCLNEINLHIPLGKSVAIVGAAGTGKSTLLKLLLGILTPDSGAVSWNGLLLSKENADALRRRTHYGWQNSEIIGDTVGDYLAMGNDRQNYSQEQIIDLLKRVQLSNLLPFLNKGLNTRWIDIPVPISAIQRQQLTVARLLLSQHKISVLDNPSANLEPGSEHILLENIKQRIEKKETVIIATDRTNVVALVDHVIMLKDGKVVFDGDKAAFANYLQESKK